MLEDATFFPRLLIIPLLIDQETWDLSRRPECSEGGFALRASAKCLSSNYTGSDN